jgi:PRTRC genetic system protein E
MIKELLPLLQHGMLSISLSLVGKDRVRLVVQNRPHSEKMVSDLSKPLALEGTAEEFDKELPRILIEYTSTHKEIRQQWMDQREKMGSKEPIKEAPKEQTPLTPLRPSRKLPVKPAPSPPKGPRKPREEVLNTDEESALAEALGL